MRAGSRSTTVTFIPFPIHNRHMRVDMCLIRPTKLKIEPRSFILDPLGIMQDFDQEREIMIGHQPTCALFDTVHPKYSRISIAAICGIGVRRPHAWTARWHLAKEAEFAFEEKLRECRLRVRRAVEVCEAERVRVAGIRT